MQSALQEASYTSNGVCFTIANPILVEGPFGYPRSIFSDQIQSWIQTFTSTKVNLDHALVWEMVVQF